MSRRLRVEEGRVFCEKGTRLRYRCVWRWVGDGEKNYGGRLSPRDPECHTEQFSISQALGLASKACQQGWRQGDLWENTFGG